MYFIYYSRYFTCIYIICVYACVCAKLLQLCPTVCDPMDCSTSGLLVHLQLPELTQTHVH